MSPIQSNQLAVAISDQANQLGLDISPDQVSKRLDQASMLIGETYRVVTEQLIPTAAFYIGQLYNWYMSDSEAPQTALEDRKLEAVAVEPQMKAMTESKMTESKKQVEPEEEFFTAEWDGLTDDDFKDCVEYMDTPKTLDQPKTKKPVEDTVVVSKKETVADTQKKAVKKKAAKKKGPKIGFGSHLPPAKFRKEGMTDREYMNMFESNIRSMEDPLKPKNTRKARSFSRLDKLATAKTRSEDLYPSNHQVEMNFRASLRK